MTGLLQDRAIKLHLGVLLLLFALQFVLPAYHHNALARILVLASYAIGFNVLMGYTGLLSLGHALFFAAGLYGTGLTAQYLSASVPITLLSGALAGTLLAIAVGLLALRTAGVAFMIVTMMFALAGFLALLYFNDVTKGDQGFVVPESARQIVIGGTTLALSNPLVRYNLALGLFACALFGYVGATFADTQYSIYPILWGLLGGIGTTLGPLIGTLLMFYLVEVASGYTPAYNLEVGIALVLLVLWFPKGILGTLREKYFGWLP